MSDHDARVERVVRVVRRRTDELGVAWVDGDTVRTVAAIGDDTAAVGAALDTAVERGVLQRDGRDRYAVAGEPGAADEERSRARVRWVDGDPDDGREDHDDDRDTAALATDGGTLSSYIGAGGAREAADPPATEEVAAVVDVPAADLEAFVERADCPTAAAVLGFAVADASNRRLVGRWLAAQLDETPAGGERQ